MTPPRWSLPFFQARTPKRYLPVPRHGQDLSSFSDASPTESDTIESLLEKHQYCEQCESQVSRRPLWRSPMFLLGHAVLLAFYLSSLYYSRSILSARDNGLPYSPGLAGVEYHNVVFTNEDTRIKQGRYHGVPSPAMDKAWHDLIAPEIIKVEPKYIQYFGREEKTVAVPGEDAYLGTLNVYHELHCIKRLHRALNADYYYPNHTEAERAEVRMHSEHCIDFLRQAAMCHGDTGLITWQWDDDTPFPVANATSHQCVDWDKLEQWNRERSVDMMKPGWLVHPTKGVVNWSLAE